MVQKPPQLPFFKPEMAYKKGEIADVMRGYYDIDFTLDEIRPSYRFDGSCQGTVSQAIVPFVESTDYVKNPLLGSA